MKIKKKPEHKKLHTLLKKKKKKYRYSKSLKWAGYAHLVFFSHIFILHLIARTWLTTLLRKLSEEMLLLFPYHFHKGEQLLLTSSFFPGWRKPFQSGVKGRMCTFNKSWTLLTRAAKFKMAELLNASPKNALIHISWHSKASLVMNNVMDITYTHPVYPLDKEGNWFHSFFNGIRQCWNFGLPNIANRDFLVSGLGLNHGGVQLCCCFFGECFVEKGRFFEKYC